MATEIDFGKLKLTIEVEGELSVYTFVGEVEDGFRSEKVPLPTTSRCKFMLSGIEHFNSCGIAEWIYLVKNFGAKSSIEFHECSIAMTDQMNMVPDSKGSATIVSFLAPYFDSKEDEEVTKLIDVEKFRQELKMLIAPVMKDADGNELEFDALEESYFQFLQKDLSSSGAA